MSCEPEELQLGAVGVAIIVTVMEDGAAVDISTVTAKSLVFRKPNGTTATVTASFYTDGTDGKLVYVTEASPLFLDTAGEWLVQPDITFPSSGFDGTGSLVAFQVLPNA